MVTLVPLLITPEKFFSISEQKLTIDANRNKLCFNFLILQIFLTVSQGTKTVKVSRVSPSWAFRETEATKTQLYIFCLASISYFCTKREQYLSVLRSLDNNALTR